MPNKRIEYAPFGRPTRNGKAVCSRLIRGVRRVVRQQVDKLEAHHGDCNGVAVVLFVLTQGR